MKARDYLEELAGSGRHHFTTSDATAALGGSAASARAQLRRLRGQGLIAEPSRGFHVIVPPEYRRLGCLPADQFIDALMDLGGEPYYMALLSAAERFGAAHQRPQSTQVMVRKSRRSLRCGLVKIDFIARHDLENMPVRSFNTPRGIVRVSTSEVTALELVGYPGHAGGIGNVASVVTELAESLDPAALAHVATLCPVSWSQRLGYLLELSGSEEVSRRLEAFVAAKARGWTPLRRAADLERASWEPRWKLIVNADVEAEA
jgi:predicted transcriptional regulator of viral defense system